MYVAQNLPEDSAFVFLGTVNSGKKVTGEATETDDDEPMSRWSSDSSGVGSVLAPGAKQDDGLARSPSAGDTVHPLNNNKNNSSSNNKNNNNMAIICLLCLRVCTSDC